MLGGGGRGFGLLVEGGDLGGGEGKERGED